MAIKIKSFSKVYPIQSTPNGKLTLSESDQIMAWVHVPTIHVYKPTKSFDSSLSLDTLKSSLSQILVPYYPLAGRLHWIGGGRLELHCCSNGVEFIEAYCDGKLDDFGDFKPNEEIRELIPNVDYSQPIEQLPVFLVKVTRFSCGGLCIGMALSHIIVDGISAITFINSWASIARGDKTKESILQPYHDRKVLKLEKSVNMPHFDHNEYKRPPVLAGCEDVNEESKKKCEVVLLKLSKEQIDKLKKRANEMNTEPLDLITEIPATAVSIFVNIRKRLKAAVPEGYAGNATLVATPTSHYGDLISKPLSFAAGKIREGISNLTDEYIKSAFDYLESQEDMGLTRSSHQTVDYTQLPFWGNPNLSLGSWITLPLYGADFGWGKPAYVGPAEMISDGEALFMPGPNDDASLIIALSLQTNHMAEFMKYFYQDF